jgi:ribonuclease HII
MQKYTIGIDEAGRGPLAGPVAVGVCMVPSDFDYKLVAGARDSKKMTPKAREKIYAVMCALREQGALDFTVAFSSAQMIDGEGIVSAIQNALDTGLDTLFYKGQSFAKKKVGSFSCQVLLDGGLKAPPEYVHQKTIIRGDDSEIVISLASIVAKVERDRLMCIEAKKYPVYGFAEHKGYGTALHRKHIRKHGLSPSHRATFCTRILRARST